MSEEVFGPSDTNRRQRDGWARFLARMSDILLLVLPGTFVVGVGMAAAQFSGVLPGDVPGLGAGRIADWLAGLLIALVVSLLLESLLLSTGARRPASC